MEERILNFAEKPVQVLTLEELERSYHENLPTGDPVGGIYHFALIREVLNMFEKHGLKPMIPNIEIRCDETDDIVTCLAVAYHQKGVQLGIGPMVKVCHNQTILGAQDVVSNYTCYNGQNRKDKYSLEMVLPQSLALYETMIETINH